MSGVTVPAPVLRDRRSRLWMKYVVLGSGALGSIIGGHLTQAREEVIMLARGARAAHLREHGIVVRSLEYFSVSCHVSEVRPMLFAILHMCSVQSSGSHSEI